MHFLPDVYVPCEQCHGKRFNRETLEVRYKGKTIADVLDMSVEEAVEFFEHDPEDRAGGCRRCTTSGSTTSGSASRRRTLSGGEAQRVKLATELSKVATGDTLYILDEPTTGLHFADVERLLEVLDRLVDQGNTVVVIEHNLDVIKTADWHHRPRPRGRRRGRRDRRRRHARSRSRRSPASYTGRFLRDLVEAEEPAPKPRRTKRKREPVAA